MTVEGQKQSSRPVLPHDCFAPESGLEVDVTAHITIILNRNTGVCSAKYSKVGANHKVRPK